MKIKDINVLGIEKNRDMKLKGKYGFTAFSGNSEQNGFFFFNFSRNFLPTSGVIHCGMSDKLMAVPCNRHPHTSQCVTFEPFVQFWRGFI